MAYSPLLGLGRLLGFLILYTAGSTPWTGISTSQGLYLHTEQHKHRMNAQTTMPQVGFETTIPVFKRANTIHVLDRAVTVWIVANKTKSRAFM
jgi:hypothetical protein